MIIKRSHGAQMPSLKRCKADSAEGGAVAGLGRSRKRWKGGKGDCFLLEVVGDLGGSVGIPFAGAVPAGDDLGPSTSSSEVVSQLTAFGDPPRRRRSPIARTKRGREHVLPSRFGVSFLIETRRKAKIKFRATDTDFEEEGKLTETESKTSFGLLGRQDCHCHRACQNVKEMKSSLSPSSLTFLHESSEGEEEEIVRLAFVNLHESASTSKNTSSDKTEQGEVLRSSMKFALGDVVWAKPGKMYPAWPAIVVNPIQGAPASVSKSLIAGAICVMLIGYSGNGEGRKYALVNHEMVFPFIDYLDSFQGQTELYNSKPSELRLAIEKAFLAEHGFLGMEVDERAMSMAQTYPRGPFHGEFQETTGSNQDQECLQDANNPGIHCDNCVARLPIVRLKNAKGDLESSLSKKTHTKQKCLEDGDSSSPECKLKHKFGLLDTEKKKEQLRNLQVSLPQELLVCCYGMEGTYLPEQHVVICHCLTCKGKKATLSEWERHTGCRSKKWKCSVKVKSSMTPLGEWVCTPTKT